MNRRKEPCRNFQRGSCQYGERCKFLHVTQQQPKANPPNPFGFGVQNNSQFHTNQQQQKPNPFGFGIQNSSQPKGASDIGAKYQNQVKPFENKWSRFSPVASPSSPLFRQTDSQPQAANHKCTEPESCKRQIVEDFEHERPLWKLTCYGHWKYLPCDIVGDISYEELRAAAYEDARRGLPLQSIVERERNLLNSKLVEFENLLRNPYVISTSPSSAGPNPFPGTNIHASSMGVQNNLPSSVSSFSQLGPSVNPGFSTRSLSTSNSGFGQSGSFPISAQAPGEFGANRSTFGSPGSIGSQSPMQPFGNAATFNHSVTNAGNDPFSFSPVASTLFPMSERNQSSSFSNGPNSTPNAAGQAFMNNLSVDKSKTDVSPEDMKIWLKAEWKAGEIPEESPPDAFL